jgi:RND family efflux transporter MFP subunit
MQRCICIFSLTVSRSLKRPMQATDTIRSRTLRGLSVLSRFAMPWVALALSACSGGELPKREAVRVKVIAIKAAGLAPEVTLTGEIKARFQNDISFRVNGKIVERKVDASAHVAPGELLARLDCNEQEASLKSAKAAVEAAEAQLKQASSAFERQKSLMVNGYTTRRDLDQAQEAFRTAEAALDTAKAQQSQAEDQLTYTELKADAGGLITARFAEVGQVVQAAQPVFTVARDGPRDGVFDIDEARMTYAAEGLPEDMTVRVALASDPSIVAEGFVREVSPTVNASNGTIRVKVELKSVPAGMTLGAPVIGSAQMKGAEGFAVPWDALVKAGSKPAVWVADPKSNAVSLRPVTVARYQAGRVLLKDGLKRGELVVTAGSQLLWPGRVVEPIEEAGQ